MLYLLYLSMVVTSQRHSTCHKHQHYVQNMCGRGHGPVHKLLSSTDIRAHASITRSFFSNLPLKKGFFFLCSPNQTLTPQMARLVFFSSFHLLLFLTPMLRLGVELTSVELHQTRTFEGRLPTELPRPRLHLKKVNFLSSFIIGSIPEDPPTSHFLNVCFVFQLFSRKLFFFHFNFCPISFPHELKDNQIFLLGFVL